MIKNLIFDLGGVLLNLNTRATLEAFKAILSPSTAQTVVSVGDLLGAGESALIRDFQVGKCSTQDVVNALMPFCKEGTTAEQICYAFDAMLTTIPENRLQTLKELKNSGLRIFLLSNTNEEHWRYAEKYCFGDYNINLNDYFERVFLSHEMQLCKPNRDIYEKVIEETGIVPEETLYIDDLQQNIDTGAAIGFHTLCAIGDEWIERVRMLTGLEYDACNKNLIVDLNAVKDLCWEYNNLRPTLLQERNQLIQKILGKADADTFINQPFYCDYGKHIFVGQRFFANFSLTILDEAYVSFGDDCFVGPNVSIYTACHSTDPVQRNTRREWAKPVTIGNNVWIGGSVTILPGVTIGDNVTIGAGSVVVKDVPANTVVGGVPARVLHSLGHFDSEE